MCIDNSGRMVFGTSTSAFGTEPIRQRLYMMSEGSLGLLASSGDLIANHPSFRYASFERPTINDDGTLAFVSETTTPAQTAVVTGQPGAFQLTALRGPDPNPVPGYPSGLGLIARPAPLSNAGAVAFTEGGVSRSVWFGAPGALQRVFGDSDPIPGQSATASSVAGAGVYGNTGVLIRGLVGSQSGAPRFAALATPQGLTVLAGPGLPAPGTTGVFTAAGNPATCSSSAIAFSASYVEGGIPRSGVWLGTPGNFSLLARSGDAAPGMTGFSLTSFVTPTLTESGRGFLRASASDGSTTSFGVWDIQEDELQLAFRGGSQIENLPTGNTLHSVNADGAIAVNEAGQMEFLGTVRTGPTTQQFGLLAYDPSLGLMSVARIGETFQVGPGDTRTISAIHTLLPDVLGAGLGGDDGLGRYLTDDGRLVFTLDFADQSSGIFSTIIPAPSSAVAGCVWGLLAWRRTRK